MVVLDRARRHPGQGVSPTGPATCLPGPAPPADSGMPRGMKPVGLRLVSDSVKVLVWRAAAGARPVPKATVIFKVSGTSGGNPVDEIK